MPIESDINKLSGSSWNAGLEYYDFLHGIDFKPDLTGKMLSGGGQRLALDIDFRYELLQGGGIRFNYLPTTNETWGLRFIPSKQDNTRTIGMMLNEGSFEVENPFGKIDRYGYKLQFNDSPFPRTPYPDTGLLDFYGYPLDIPPRVWIDQPGDNLPDLVKKAITPESIAQKRTWNAYKNCAPELIIEQQFVFTRNDINDPDLKSQFLDLRRLFMAVAYFNLNSSDQSYWTRRGKIEEEAGDRPVVIDHDLKESIIWIWETHNLKRPSKRKLGAKLSAVFESRP